jgi:short-subunit dehydrogenase
VVNVGSGEGFLATPLNAPYCMAKHALEAFTESLRLELAPSGIAVSA